jgi:hypothetical protein
MISLMLNPIRIARKPRLPQLAALSTVLLAGLTAAATPMVNAEPKTVCTVTINSADERDTFQRFLPRDQYRIVELVQRGQPDWLAQACRRGVTCDALIISGHFDDGNEFYTDHFDDHEGLTVYEMQHAACSASCSTLFSQLKEVYLFGCNTLKSEPRNVATGEILRSLVRTGHSQADAERVATLLNERYGESNRERLRHIFKDVPVLYGFSSMAPRGRYAGPLLERYFKTAPAGEVASGRPSQTLLRLFGPTSMISVAGLTEADPQASFRGEMCAFADDRPSEAQKVDFMHEVLQRDMADVRMFLEHLEHYASSISAAQRLRPDVAAALARIEADQRTRERYLEFARDVDQAPVQARMIALARTLGWLTPAQEQDEFVRMIADRMARSTLGKYEVDLVCGTAQVRDAGLAQRVLATGAVRPGEVAHWAALACLGNVQAHGRTLRALTSEREDDVEIAQVYLRHRPLADVREVRAVTADIGRMTTPGAQVRALQTLAKQHLADPQSLLEIVRLFPLARSLDVQRAIANILIRSDYRSMARADLARSLQQHRLKSPDGQDVIDLLIRLLQTA